MGKVALITLVWQKRAYMHKIWSLQVLLHTSTIQLLFHHNRSYSLWNRIMFQIGLGQKWGAQPGVPWEKKNVITPQKWCGDKMARLVPTSSYMTWLKFTDSFLRYHHEYFRVCIMDDSPSYLTLSHILFKHVYITRGPNISNSIYWIECLHWQHN